MRIMTWNVQGRVGDWEVRHGALRSWIQRTAARRSTQMAALVNHLADTLGDETQRRDSLPAILAGDLNCTPESDEYRSGRQRLGQ